MLKAARHHCTCHAAAGILALLALASPSAFALTYRCELPASQAGGAPEVRYQSQACDGGQTLHNADQRTEGQRAETAKAEQANAKLGRQLERERHRYEKQGAGRRPIAMDKGGPPAKPTSTSTQGQILKREHPFTARTPKATHGKNGQSD